MLRLIDNVFCVSSIDLNEMLLFKNYRNIWTLIAREMQLKIPLASRNCDIFFLVFLVSKITLKLWDKRNRQDLFYISSSYVVLMCVWNIKTSQWRKEVWILTMDVKIQAQHGEHRCDGGRQLRVFLQSTGSSFCKGRHSWMRWRWNVSL